MWTVHFPRLWCRNLQWAPPLAGKSPPERALPPAAAAPPASSRWCGVVVPETGRLAFREARRTRRTSTSCRAAIRAQWLRDRAQLSAQAAGVRGRLGGEQRARLCRTSFFSPISPATTAFATSFCARKSAKDTSASVRRYRARSSSVLVRLHGGLH